MFKKKIKEQKTTNNINDDYQLPDYFNTDKLVVANIESVSNKTDIPIIEITDQKYIFEVINNNKKRYREIFTGYVIDKKGEIGYFNVPYATNITPLKKAIPGIESSIPKLSLLFVLNEVNKDDKKETKKKLK